LFVSAFILFLVQPLIGKMILPKLGGTPQVWNTCCVFFQMVLLAGYAYTHTISSRLKLRQQIALHTVMLLLPLAVLFLPDLLGLPSFFTLYISVDKGGWSPGNLGGNPIPTTLGILFLVIGVPFLVVSTTAPLLQKWFAYTGHPAARDPYFLYGASNLGSLLALVAYPVVIEPALGLSWQTWVWAIGYFVLIGGVLACIGLVRGVPAHSEHHPEHVPAAPAETAASAVATTSEPQTAATAVTASPPAPSKPTGIKAGKKKFAGPGGRGPGGSGGSGGPGGPAGEHAATAPIAVKRSIDEIDAWRRLRWVGLAAVPSSLMLGITTHITTDLSPIPLFWVIPLALYLLTFILVFARWPIVWTDVAHPFVLYLQPVAIAVMLFLDMFSATTLGVLGLIISNMLGFFFTTLACHGELAKDRPSTRHLTEFYLWMSVGGMLGGMFNALLAPVIFTGLAELNIAILAACLLRPRMKDSGWTDDLIANVLEPAPEAPAQHQRGGKHPRPVAAAAAKSSATPQMALALDFILPLIVLGLTMGLAFVLDGAVFSIAQSMSPRGSASGMVQFLTFGVPLVIACFYFGRPLRFGLAVGAVMLTHYLYTSRYDASSYNDRSFFGIISVKQVDAANAARQERVGVAVGFRKLMHGTTDHGMNFIPPDKEEDLGNPEKNYSRLATTYYHRLGPAGRVMQLFNWFPDKGADSPDNVYSADARMPAAIVGNLFGDLMNGPVPVQSFTNLWSEPPYATIGLGTGTMASYGRPYQHVHFYEIDNHILRLSMPKKPYYTYTEEPDSPTVKNKRFFTYLDQAVRRGSELEVFMGDARLRMALPYGNFAEYTLDPAEYQRRHKQEQLEYKKLLEDEQKAPEGDERKKLQEERKKFVFHYPEIPGGPERFYHMMVVDAFSSDAIPAHLITKEAIKMYFDHLSEEGILCVHTSNRWVSLPKVVAAVALALTEELPPDQIKAGYTYSVIRGNDAAPFGKVGHYNSEWVMVARKPEYLARVKALEPEGYMAALREKAKKDPMHVEADRPYWNALNQDKRFLWTDDYYTLWTVLRRSGDRD
jgi:hypothetical protein